MAGRCCRRVCGSPAKRVARAIACSRAGRLRVQRPGRNADGALLGAAGGGAQVDYVFSDKTGTLTSNEMQLRELAVKGATFGSSQFRRGPLSAAVGRPDAFRPVCGPAGRARPTCAPGPLGRRTGLPLSEGNWPGVKCQCVRGL